MPTSTKPKPREVWNLAAAVERCALGWERDAEFYLGERRQVRLDRADYLHGRAEFLCIHAVDLEEARA